jgi:hypothetical protein
MANERPRRGSPEASPENADADTGANPDAESNAARSRRPARQRGGPDVDQAKALTKAAKYCDIGFLAVPAGMIYSCALAAKLGPWIGPAFVLLGLGFGIQGLRELKRAGPVPDAKDLPPSALRTAARRARHSAVKGWVGVVLCALYVLTVTAVTLLASAIEAHVAD